MGKDGSISGVRCLDQPIPTYEKSILKSFGKKFLFDLLKRKGEEMEETFDFLFQFDYHKRTIFEQQLEQTYDYRQRNKGIRR